MAAPEISPVRETLTWSRALVDPALRAAVDTLPSSMRRVAGYHLGWFVAGVEVPCSSHQPRW
jgi:geranylgeranyl diphosphate synthase type I